MEKLNLNGVEVTLNPDKYAPESKTARVADFETLKGDGIGITVNPDYETDLRSRLDECMRMGSICSREVYVKVMTSGLARVAELADVLYWGVKNLYAPEEKVLTPEEAGARYDHFARLAKLRAAKDSARDLAYEKRLARYGVKELTRWGNWASVGRNVNSGKIWSPRLRLAGYWKDISGVILEEFDAAAASLESLNPSTEVVVLGFLSGNSWEEAVFSYESLDRMVPWLFGTTTSVSPTEALRLMRENGETVPNGKVKSVALAILRDKRILTGDEWTCVLATVGELKEALTTGGDVPSWYTPGPNPDDVERLKTAVEEARKVDVTDPKKVN